MAKSPFYLNMHMIWISFNPSMDKQTQYLKVWDLITYPFPNFNGSWSLGMDKYFYLLLY